MVELTPVDSSNIAAVGYDAEALELHVVFNSGASYKYLNVPQAVYDSLMSSDSKGQYLNMAIKSQFEYVQT